MPPTKLTRTAGLVLASAMVGAILACGMLVLAAGTFKLRGPAMDIVAMAAVGIMLATPLLVAIGMALAHDRRAKENERVFRAVADRFGLTPSSEGLIGQHGGIIVRARFVTRNRHQSPHVVVEAVLAPALDLGLHATSWQGRPHPLSITAGDPAIDERFVIRGKEPQRIRALLQPAVRDAWLRAAAARGFATLSIDDHSATLEAFGFPREDLLTWAIPVVADIAAAMQTAFRQPPPPLALRALGHAHA